MPVNEVGWVMYVSAAALSELGPKGFRGAQPG